MEGGRGRKGGGGGIRSNTHGDSLAHRSAVCPLVPMAAAASVRRAMPRIVSIVRQSIGKLILDSEWSDAFFFFFSSFFFFFFFLFFLSFFFLFFWVARVFKKLPLFGVEY